MFFVIQIKCLSRFWGTERAKTHICRREKSTQYLDIVCIKVLCVLIVYFFLGKCHCLEEEERKRDG